VDIKVDLVVPTTWASNVRALPTKAVDSRDLHLSSSKVLMEVLVSIKGRGVIASVNEKVFRYFFVIHVDFNSKWKKKSILV
jgi:hypothetical protein